jgi:hypothetical protein
MLPPQIAVDFFGGTPGQRQLYSFCPVFPAYAKVLDLF